MRPRWHDRGPCGELDQPSWAEPTLGVSRRSIEEDSDDRVRRAKCLIPRRHRNVCVLE
jgi:hypothetical protein